MTISADTTSARAPLRREVPRLHDDYSTTAARQRMAFLADAVGVVPEHVGRYSFDLDVFTAGIRRGLAELSGRAAR